MKQIYIAALAVCITTASYAQIGGLIGKAKDKANKTVEKATSPSTSTPSGSSGSSSSGSSGSSTGSTVPTSEVASYEKNNLKYALQDLEKKYLDKGYKGYLDEDFAKAQGYIDKIKEKDKSYNVEPQQKKLDELYEAYKNNGDKLNNESQYNFLVLDVSQRVSSNGRDGYFTKYSYADYKAGRDSYEKSETADYKKFLPDCDKFYNELYPKYVQENVLKEFRDYKLRDMNDEYNKLNPESVIRGYKEKVAEIDRALIPLKTGDPAEAELNKFKTTYNGEITKYETYMSDGSFAKFKVDYAAAQVAKVRFPKALSSNPTWEARAKAEVTGYFTSGVVIQRVAVCTNAWQIKKNDYDLPVYRYQWVTVAFKKNSDGKCYMVDVFVQQDYAGGGTWNDGYKYNLDADTKEILCENVNK